MNWPSRALPWKGVIPFSKTDNAALHLMGILHPPTVVRRYRQALSQLYGGKVQSAVAAIADLSKELGNRDVVLANKLASLYISYGYIHPALKIFHEIDQGDRTHTPWHCNMLASAYTAAGHTEKARRVYTHMLALNIGDRLETYLALAQTYELEGALQEACHVYELTWNEFPDDGYVGIKLACLWYNLNRQEKAEVILLKLLSEADTAEFTLYKGMAYLALGNVKMAIPFLSRAREIYTADSLPAYYLAICYIMRNHQAQAEIYLREAFQKDISLWDTDVEILTGIVLTSKQFESLLAIWPVE